jgi:L-glutamine-phosphate cytidylyltransferase
VRAIILAAGRGLRLRDVTADGNKCLTPIGGVTLIERQIRSLRACGIEAVTVVAGFRADDVRRACDARVDFVINEQYESTNSLYSLWLARHLIGDGFVVLNGDVLFHRQMLWDLLTSRDEDALLMSARRGEPYTDEEMKVRVRAGCVTAIAKDLDAAETDGENVGIAKFGPDGAAALAVELERAVARGGAREWLPRAFDAFARRRPLHVVETRGFPWTEIDSPEDYWRACSDVLPAITALEHAGIQPASGRTQGPAKRAGRLVHHV